jgi:endonuclease G
MSKWRWQGRKVFNTLLGSLVLALIVCFGVLALADRNYGSVHLLLGNPSQATLVSTNASNYLMLKPEYALSYNRERGLPNWVSWQLNATWLGRCTTPK